MFYFFALFTGFPMPSLMSCLCRIRLGTGPIFSDRTGPAGLSFSTGPDRPLPAGRNNLLKRQKNGKNRPVRILNFTGVKPVHFMHQLNTQHLQKTLFCFNFDEDIYCQTPIILEVSNSNSSYFSLPPFVC
jgi:hypothetical protein